jgi:hypothetical protein
MIPKKSDFHDDPIKPFFCVGCNQDRMSYNKSMLVEFLSFVTVILTLSGIILLSFFLSLGLIVERQILCWLHWHKYENSEEHHGQAVVCFHCNKVKWLN